jgi:hypothetical protein
MAQPFPPSGPTTLTSVLPAYAYQQFSDDDNIQALIEAYNIYAQQYLNWFNTVNLPIYTGLSGALLDWVGTGLYGLPRPSLASGQIVGVGPLNTWAVNTIAVDAFYSIGAIQNPTVTDDIYKRIITWFFFKGDGQQFCTLWLKRRIMRFLTGTGGTAPNIDNTYPVSIAFSGAGVVAITITLTTAFGIPLSVAEIFQSAVAAGAIELPFQLSFSVTIVNSLGPTNLVNNGGLLGVATGAGWPTNDGGLPVGGVWNNGGLASVRGPTTPNPFASPVFFGLITAAQLQVLSGANLPTSDPMISSQLWNNGGMIAISS